jgi:hypothetical protein
MCLRADDDVLLTRCEHRRRDWHPDPARVRAHRRRAGDGRRPGQRQRGFPNPVATVADGLAGASPWTVVELWTTAALVLLTRSRAQTALVPCTGDQQDNGVPSDGSADRLPPW